MGHRESTTAVNVQIVALRRLSPEQEALCRALREEAGRCWTDMVNAHVASRGEKKWLSVDELEKQHKQKYALHSTCIQGLAQKLGANIATARQLRRAQKKNGGEITARFPYREKQYQTVIWKENGIRWMGDGRLRLSNKSGDPPLILSVPAEHQDMDIRKAELTWRADHYELCLTIDTGVEPPEPAEGCSVAGVDLGEIHIAAVCTDAGDALLVSGRALRSVKRLRNKRLAAYHSRLSRCKPGSKRHRRWLKNKNRTSAILYRQQRDILHKASRHVVDFCAKHKITHIAIGDVRDIQNGVKLGSHSNQKISQWPHGQFKQYTEYKSRLIGMTVAEIAEDYSSRTCSHCSHVINYAPKGRTFSCPRCGAVIHRDVNGSANICSRFAFGSYGSVHPHTLMCLRPIRRRRAFDTGQGIKPLLLAQARTPRL